MSKFLETSYTTPTEILKYEHFVSIGVTVSDSGISANSDGKKIVPAGTIVGGVNSSALLDDTQLVSEKNTAGVAATATIVFGTPVANDTVILGEHTFKYVASVANPNEFSTAAQLTTLINSTDEFTAVNASGTITVTSVLKGTAANSIPTGKTGTGTETVSTFSGGTAGTGASAEGVLLEDVDVTYGAASGSMVIHGFININKLPSPPSADAVKALAGRIVFME